MWKKLFVSIILLTLALPFAIADVDNFFSVKENFGPYEAVPGDEVVIEFTLSNRDLVTPRDVRVYIDPCPVGWDCEEKTLSFDDTGIHATNLTIDTPKTASPKKYTLYIMLESEWMTRRGNDRILLTLLTEKQAETLSYEEYLARQEEEEQRPEPEPEEVPEPELYLEEEPEIESEVEAEELPVEVEADPEEESEETVDIIPIINESEIAEGVERLESSSQFVEYASIVLIVILVFVAAGAYITFKKE
jgi:hypothetical protein